MFEYIKEAMLKVLDLNFNLMKLKNRLNSKQKKENNKDKNKTQ